MSGISDPNEIMVSSLGEENHLGLNPEALYVSGSESKENHSVNVERVGPKPKAKKMKPHSKANYMRNTVSSDI